jgi:hypothetical protein
LQEENITIKKHLIISQLMSWSIDKSVSELPDKIAKEFRSEAKGLLKELEDNKLQIGLVPAPEPKHSSHMIRVVLQSNPFWYSNLYQDYWNFRRDRSLKALKRLAEGKDMPYSGEKGAVQCYFRYDKIYREFILDRLVNGYFEEDGMEIPPSKKIRKALENILQQK